MSTDFVPITWGRISRLPPLMRRLAVLALVLPALAGAGCGGGKDSSGPLDEGLRYLPADAPFAVSIDTDVDGGQYKAAGTIAGKFPFGRAELRRRLEGLFQRGDVDFEEDVKPLLGNPFVVGAVSARSFSRRGESNDFVGAIKTKDGDKLDELVKKDKADQKGEKNGAKLYEDSGGDSFAVKDDVLIVAGSRRLLEEALDRRDGGDTLDEDRFDAALSRLPKEALVRAYFNVKALVDADRRGRQASRIKWVGALRTLGLTASAADDEISVDFNLKTDADGLSERDLPIATGAQASAVVQRPGELGLGLRDPSHLVDFALDAAGAVEGPSVEVAKRQVEQRLGIDIEDDVSNQLTGDASMTATPSGKLGVRAELKDPAAFKRTLAKIAGALPRLAAGLGAGPVELSKPKRGSGLYALAGPERRRVYFGVLGAVLVISNDPADASRLAREKPKPVEGAKGALVLRADAEKLATAILAQLSSQLGPLGGLGGQLFTGPLGDLTGGVTSSTGGMKGSLRLTFH